MSDQEVTSEPNADAETNSPDPIRETDAPATAPGAGGLTDRIRDII